ncbi:hypothetical protein QTI24_10510 [Variovorax sp. J22P240]|uniref:hypothetical protein n=1 Tax=Variovorax sp. J22P240 TaxID=3053514 RepID=UPI0025768FC1|nr:hypothetical protein [Variovorax sp. J22P240]MDL9999034.1 hypothetical protein [Variovorax sp. J22P240]
MTTTPFATGTDRPGIICFSVHDNGRPLSDASCSLFRIEPAPPAGKSAKLGHVDHYVTTASTQGDGRGVFPKQPAGNYHVICHHVPEPTQNPSHVTVECNGVHDVCFELGLDVRTTAMLLNPDCTPNPCRSPQVGDDVEVRIEYNYSDQIELEVDAPASMRPIPNVPNAWRYHVATTGLQQLRMDAFVPFVPVSTVPDVPGGRNKAGLGVVAEFEGSEKTPQPVTGDIGVALQRTATVTTSDLSLWQGILNSTGQLAFNNYLHYMDTLFCGETDSPDLPDFEQARFQEKRRTFREELRPKRLLPFTDSDAYRVVKAATEAFVMVNCGVLRPPRPFDRDGDLAYLKRRDLPPPGLAEVETVFTDQYLVPFRGGRVQDRTLPYLAVIRSKLPDIGIKLQGLDSDLESVGQCTGILQEKLANPCLLELIWSYWHEEGMLVQTMNSIARRFQNVRSGERDPLANLEIDPLRPLNNVLWGYVQDEQHRLSIVRRNYEYDHHYGLRLEGKAVQRMQAADSRSRFIEAFHNLLRYCTSFFKQDDDTTVKADAFPVLNALKEVHLILSQGAHNQFGDLPSTARIEMLMQQWLLARPEFREFLPTRIMTAYPEPWMDRVDAMKKVQGWTDTSVLHFRNLAIFGEQVLLSIRWGHWSDVQDPLQAFNWARFFRPQIQGYSHAYRSVTGVELALESPDAKVDATLPSVLLQRRLATQQRAA